MVMQGIAKTMPANILTIKVLYKIAEESTEKEKKLVYSSPSSIVLKG
jgi:hypothetical protein